MIFGIMVCHGVIARADLSFFLSFFLRKGKCRDSLQGAIQFQKLIKSA